MNSVHKIIIKQLIGWVSILVGVIFVFVLVIPPLDERDLVLASFTSDFLTPIVTIISTLFIYKSLKEQINANVKLKEINEFNANVERAKLFIQSLNRINESVEKVENSFYDSTYQLFIEKISSKDVLIYKSLTKNYFLNNEKISYDEFRASFFENLKEILIFKRNYSENEDKLFATSVTRLIVSDMLKIGKSLRSLLRLLKNPNVYTIDKEIKALIEIELGLLVNRYSSISRLSETIKEETDQDLKEMLDLIAGLYLLIRDCYKVIESSDS